MDDRLTRIENKLDHVLESHGQRISRVETSAGWLKWAFSLLLTVASVAALALSRYVN